MAIDIIARAMAASKADLVNGKIPADELPSYVDDVEEFPSFSDFPAQGEEGKIYVDLSSGYTYRWSGSMYVQIGLTALDDKIGLVELTGTTGILNADQMASAQKEFAQLRLDTEVYMKVLEDADKIIFRSTVFEPQTLTLSPATIESHYVTITKATSVWKAWNYVEPTP